MSRLPAGAGEEQRKCQWVWPLDLARYDRSPALRREERIAIATMSAGNRRREFAREPWKTKLCHLLAPIVDALKFSGATRPILGSAVTFLFNEMLRRNSSLWSWGECEWETVLRVPIRTYSRARGVRGEIRPHMLALALLLRRIRDPRRCGHFERVPLANKVFSEPNVEASTRRVAETLKRWGFSDLVNRKLQSTVLCDVLLLNGSPLLEDLTAEVFEEAYEAETTVPWRRSLQRISRVLVGLGLIQRALPHGYSQARGGKRIDLTAGISPEWVAAAKRWRDTSTLTPKTRKGLFYVLLKVGRWLSATHPDEAAAELWTRETAARCVAEICRMTDGQWRDRSYVQDHPEKHLSPKTVHGHLFAVRVFFRDCQEWGWIEQRFDPNRYLRTPTSVRRLIGPDPRIVGDDNWAKLVWAGLNLTEPDLPCTEHGRFLYPFQMLRALTMMWLFSGLRCDEMQRLRVGSIRWKGVETNESQNATKQTCLLHVPVNKTSTAFVKPVDPLVGRRLKTGKGFALNSPRCWMRRLVNSFTSSLCIGPAESPIDI
jgi:hypothetical protein